MGAMSDAKIVPPLKTNSPQIDGFRADAFRVDAPGMDAPGPRAFADKPWTDALCAAQDAAAAAHAGAMFWARLMEITFEQGIELHPKLIAFFMLWSSKCAGPRLPGRIQFPVGELKPWLGHLALLERRGGGFLFRVCGTDLIARFGGEATGRMLESCGTAGEGLQASLVQACETRAPVAAITTIAAQHDCEIYSEIVLPLAEDGENVSLLCVGSYPRDGA